MESKGIFPVEYVGQIPNPKVNGCWAMMLQDEGARLAGEMYTYEGAGVWAQVGSGSGSSIPSAIGDGVADDTVAMQAYLTARAGKTTYIPADTYLITKNATGGLLIPSNSTLILDPNAIFKASATNWGDHGVLCVYAVENVKIIGGQVDGNRAAGSTAQNAVYVKDSHNVHIFGMKLYGVPGATAAGGSAGDGVLIRGTANPGSTFVTVEKCDISDCVRQGISLTRGKHILLLNNHITDIVGTDPGAAIDIEADSVGATCESFEVRGNYCSGGQWNIVLDGCNDGRVVGNFMMGDVTQSLLKVQGAFDIEISGNRLINSLNTAVSGNIGMCFVRESERIQFINNRHQGFGVTATQEHAHILIFDSFDIEIAESIFRNARQRSIDIKQATSGALARIDIHDNRFIDNGFSPLGVIEFFASGTGTIDDVSIENNKIYDSRSGGLEAAAGILMAGIVLARALTYRINNNDIKGTTAKHSGFPAGSAPGFIDAPVLATADLPVAATAMNGRIIIEDGGAGDRNLIVYAGGQRFRFDGGANV